MEILCVDTKSQHVILFPCIILLLKRLKVSVTHKFTPSHICMFLQYVFNTLDLPNLTIFRFSFKMDKKGYHTKKWCFLYFSCRLWCEYSVTSWDLMKVEYFTIWPSQQNIRSKICHMVVVIPTESLIIY